MDKTNETIDNFKQKLLERSKTSKHAFYSENDDKNYKNKHSYTPQDVINTVQSQMKAMQSADSAKISKNVSMIKSKMSAKTSCFLPINKLPIYREVPPDPQYKFDTECVSDTQLINIIENAEAEIESNKGISQEFNTTFAHSSEEGNSNAKTDIYECINDKNISNKCNNNIEQVNIDINSQKTEEKQPFREVIEEITVNNIINEQESIFNTNTHINNVKESIETKFEEVNKFKEDIGLEKEVEKSYEAMDTEISPCNVVGDLNNKRVCKDEGSSKMCEDTSNNAYNDDVNMLEVVNIKINNTNVTNNENLNKTDNIFKVDAVNIDTDHTKNEDTGNKDSNFGQKRSSFESDRPKSPIFNPKIKKKTKMTFPMTVPLESFENFEKIAAPILKECSNMETTKHVINSQILGKELFLNSDNCFELNMNRVSPAIDIAKDLHLNKNDILKFEKEGRANFGNSDCVKGDKNVKTDKDGKLFQKDVVFNANDKVNPNNDDRIGQINKNLDENDRKDDEKCNKTISNSAKDENFDETHTAITKKKLNIEPDEILFSSDEENEYIQIETENIQDLPLTIALETSFYDIPITEEVISNDVDTKVLKDNSMYVGFQTASNKSIEIQAETYSKAKSLLNDKVSLAELVEMCDKKDRERNSGKRAKGNVEAMDVDLESKFEDEEFNSNKDPDKDELDFIRDDIWSKFEENISNSKKKKEFLNIKSVNVISKPENTNLDENKVGKSVNDKLNKPDTEKFKGFSPDKKEIKETNAALSMYKNIINQIDGDAKLDSNDIKTELNFDNREDIDKTNDLEKKTDFGKDKYTEKAANFDKTLDLDSLNDDLLIKEFSNHDFWNKDLEIGFKTASNKNIEISEQAKSKTKDIFKDIDGKHVEFGIDKDNQKEEERKGKSKNQEEFNLPSTSKAEFVSFKTGNNKAINFPKTALVNAKNIFKDIMLDNFGNLERNNDFKSHKCQVKNDNKQSAKCFDTKSMTDSDISMKLEKYENYNETENENMAMEVDFNENANETTNNFENMKFIGFKTASNKQILLTEDKLSKSRKIFENLGAINIKPNKSGPYPKGNKAEYPVIDKPTTPITVTDKNHLYNEGSKVQDTVSNLDAVDLKAGENELYDKTVKDDIPIFKGFQTASNKAIKISKESLMKSKKILDNIDDIVLKDNILNSEGNKVENTNATRKTVDNGAAGKSNDKRVYIEDSSKNDLQIKSNRDDIPSKISKDVFTSASREVFDHAHTSKIDSYPHNDKVDIPIFKGFQTASNKPVNISKQSLEKSKKLFADVDNLTNEFDTKVNKSKDDYPVFNTVGLQEENMVNSIKTNIDDDRKSNDNNSSNFDTNTKRDKIDFAFKGFQTASNKKVSISKESLLKSKKIFEDLNDNQNIFQNVDKSEDYLEKCQSYVDKCQNYFKNIDSYDLDDPIVNKEVKTPIKTSFQGFKTVNNKKVSITQNALDKSKKTAQESIQKESGMPKKDKFKGRSKDILFRGLQIANDKQELSQNEEFNNFQNQSTKRSSDFGNINKDSFNIEGISKFESGKVNFGFQTANKKEVVVSEKALAESKNIFKDIEFSQDLSNFENRDRNFENPAKFSFATASNKQVDVSNDAFKSVKEKQFLEKQNKLFLTKNVNKSTLKKSEMTKPTLENDLNIDSLINTQVLDHFENNLNTDFGNTPNRKRSSSPILSCPRAKKRKFETPYKEFAAPSKIVQPEAKKESIVKYSENYKNNKTISLKDLVNFKTDQKVDEYFSKFNLENLLEFEFSRQRNELTDQTMRVDQLKNLFLTSINEKIVPENWLDIQIKLILWKLISYEIKFSIFVCTVQNVLDQLKYRYTRELYNTERPILRKIFEKDDVPNRTMVLCVAGIYVDGVNVASVSSTDNIELLLTDGWYFIKTSIDKMLAKLVFIKKIVVGCKIITCGAELMNCEQGIAPWEDTSAIRLKIFGNSTYPAHSYTKLGCKKERYISSLSNVSVEGGKVSSLRVYVGVVYPMLYLDKIGDGNTVTRSERLEHLYQMEYEAKRESMIEKIYEELQREMEQDPQDSEGTPEYNVKKKKSLDSGSQIAKMMRRSRDPMEFKAQLSATQIDTLQQYTERQTEQLLSKLRDRIRDKVDRRNVVSLLRVRVVGVGKKCASGLLSIWKPYDAILDLVREGAWVEVMNVVPTAIRNSEIQLSAGRQSLFKPANVKEENITPEMTTHLSKFKRKCCPIDELSLNVGSSKSFNEIDTVGVVFLIEPNNTDFDPKKDNFQNVLLSDFDKNILSVNFWGGIKKFGYQNVIEIGEVLYLSNLQKRAGNSRKNIPQFRVTELTIITKTPKFGQAKELMRKLREDITKIDVSKFYEDCVAIKNNYEAIKCFNVENASPIFDKSDFNLSKNMRFIDTPNRQYRPQVGQQIGQSIGQTIGQSGQNNKPQMVLPYQYVGLRQNSTEDFNLTGLDFDSTFKQIDTQDLSPNTLLRKKRVKEKIEKLKRYGEPPPLSSINIINKSKNAANSYKSPLITNSDSKNDSDRLESSKTSRQMLPQDNEYVVSDGNLSESKGKSSPIISLNQTYVKSSNVNPVRLNFSNNVTINSDAFDGDFDGSPPLSLE